MNATIFISFTYLIWISLLLYQSGWKNQSTLRRVAASSCFSVRSADCILSGQQHREDAAHAATANPHGDFRDAGEIGDESSRRQQQVIVYIVAFKHDQAARPAGHIRECRPLRRKRDGRLLQHMDAALRTLFHSNQSTPFHSNQPFKKITFVENTRNAPFQRNDAHLVPYNLNMPHLIHERYLLPIPFELPNDFSVRSKITMRSNHGLLMPRNGERPNTLGSIPVPPKSFPI